MPSPEQLAQLAEAMSTQQARLAAAAASATGPVRDQILQVATLLANTHKDLIAGVDEHNKKLADAVASVKATMAKTKASAEEKLANAPKPKPRPPKAGNWIDPVLEEKLQLALKTPFGNRTESKS